MSFPIPNLDDRSFQQIVDEARKRIPDHLPQWTNHNLADPGIALIELFAWMTEGIIYRLNQVPDRHYSKFLELVGLAPFPPEPATVDITFWLSSSDVEERTIESGVEVGTLQPEHGNPIVFTTVGGVLIRQPKLVACLVGNSSGGFASRLDSFRDPGSAVECFPDLHLDDCVYFGFEKPLTANVLLFDMTTTDINGVGIDPLHPPIQWEISAGGGWEAAAVPPEGDRTGGLNRNGSLLMYLPVGAAHEQRSIHGEVAYWVRGRLVDARHSYQETPGIVSLEPKSLGGQVPARQGQAFDNEELGVSTGRPGQEFAVRSAPILERAGAEGIDVHTEDGTEEWHEVTHFAYSGPEDRHYTWDSATGTVCFGPAVRQRDGRLVQHGRIPPENARISARRYLAGGGAAGNVGAGSVVVLKSTIPYIERADNRLPAVGGLDAETIENAKIRGPMSLVTGDRAVTARDFERLTKDGVRGVARARCLPASAPGTPIRLLVIPRVDAKPGATTREDLTPSQALLDQIAAHLDERRILGTHLQIGPPRYSPASVVVRISAQHGHQPDNVLARCETALYRFVNALVGGPEGQGWPWGAPLLAADVVKLLSSIDGVHRVDDVALFAGHYTPGSRGGGPAKPQRDDGATDRIEIGPADMLVSGRHWVLAAADEVAR